MTKIKVIDALPGTGKSTAIFNLMRQNKADKWIYVSPLKTEIMKTKIKVKGLETDVEGRVQKEIPELSFKAPKGNSKTTDVLKLLEDGENISCTHELFKRMGERHWQLIKDQGYRVVLDEEVIPVEWFDCKGGDVRYMIKKGSVEIEGPYSKVVLKDDLRDFDNSNLKEIAEAASQGILYTAKNPTQVNFLVTHLPIDLFVAAKQTIILTYMFKGSILDSFLKLHNLTWEPLTIKLYKTNKEVIKSLRDNIRFKSTKALDAVTRLSFSVDCYNRLNKAQRNLIGTAWRSIARHTPDDRLLTTMPKPSAHSGPNYVGNNKMRSISNSWLWSGTRATNDHADKDVVAYLVNKYPNQAVKVYFNTHNLPIDDEHFALSEMLQFLFRSALRKGKPIDLYMPSERMKNLLTGWLDGVEEELIEE